MARRCGPTKPCGMSQGLFNPFFQNGAPWMGTGGTTVDPDLQTEISLTGLTNLRTYGDSITAGTAASTTANRYVNQFASGKAMTLSNQGVSGYGARNVTALVSAQTLNPGTTLNTLMIGLNTIAQVSEVPTQFGASCNTEIEVAYRHVLTRGSIKGTEVASGNAAVTRVGTIAAFNASGGGNGGTFGTGTLPGQFATSSTGAASWSWVCPGTMFAVSFIARALHGTGTIQVNGDTVMNYDLKQYYTASFVGSVSFQFRNIPAGATITVNASGDATVALDYFAELKDPAAALLSDRPASFLFAEIPYCTPSGYATLGSGLASIAKSDAANLIIKDIVNEYIALGYNIARVRPNEHYDPVNTSDGVHPNDLGMDELTNAFNAAV